MDSFEVAMHRAALPIVSAVLVLMLAPGARAGDLPDLFPPLPWSPAGSFPNQFFGMNSAPAGDVNGDGYGDIVVSIGVEDTAQVRAVLYLGGPDGPSLVPDWTFITGPEDMRLVHPAGDVNGDGYGDILVSRAFATVSNQPFAGRVAVFHGGPAGLPAAPSSELLPPSPAANLFYGIAADFAGDVNGDGFADVVVGAPFHSEGGFSQRGVAYVYHGGPSGLAAAPARTLVGGPFAQGQFGGAAATAGDVNGDGFDDLVVGATGVPTPFLRGGTTSIFLGSPAGIAAVADTVLSGLANDSFCGTSVSTAGDVNGDGYADVLFGSPGAGGSVGRADLAFGGPNGIASRLLLSSPTAPAQDAYGTLVTTLGDTDGDGRPEFAIGARNSALALGHAFVFGGGPGFPLLGRLNPAAGATGFVQSIAPSGDVDGDGMSEILISDQYAEGTGRAYLRGRLTRVLEGAFGWPLAGPQPGTRFGNSLAIVPLRDFSALPRLVIGDPQFDGMGRVTEHRGGIESNVQTAVNHSITGTVGAQALGTRVADAGDFDGDGWGDYVVSSPTNHGGTFQNPILQVGRVDLVRGAISTPVAPIPLLAGTREFDRVGSALAGRGDVNGDGYHDVLVGAREADTATLSNAGKAWLLYGGPAPPPTWTVEGAEAGQGLGAGVALLDFDGDGYTDVAIGSTSPFAGPQLEGRVQIHYGGPGGPATVPGYVVSIPTVTFGSAVAALGDVNGDGVSDLGVGAPLENNRGVARVYAGTLGRSTTKKPLQIYAGTQDGARYGEAMAGGGDIDGDGFGDFAIGQPGFDGGHTDEGRAYLHFGALLLPEVLPGVTLEPNVTGAEMGASFAPLADVNADGYADWVVGAPGAAGRVHLSFGGGGTGIRHQLLLLDTVGDRLLHPPSRNTSDHALVAGLFPHAPMGRTRMGLQFEVRTQNEIFTGVPTITAPLEHEAGVPESEGTVIGDIDVPQPETAFHIRARQYTRSPYFQRSTWVAVDGRAMGEHDFRFSGTAVSVEPGEIGRVERPHLRPVAPSPARGATPSHIAFSLPRAAYVRVDIHDVRGGRVRRLHDGEAIAGATTLSWDGRDQAGRAAPPGIYFVRFAADGVHETARFVRLGVH